MIDRDVSAIMRGLAPVLREQIEAISARVTREASAAEAIRSAEHRAFMAESREADARRDRVFADAMRLMSEKIATVKDGVDGANGADGGDGRDGLDGAEGAAGRDGLDGKDGAPGRDGTDGKDGADGRDGLDGETGLQGPQGETGAAGADGERGESGSTGETGPQGEPGPTGERGEPGLPGEAGIDGAPGADGLNGAVGAAGMDGRDAYPGEARGLFDPDAVYRALDVVSFNGCEWRAKRDAPGELPGEGWMLSASRGKRGERGERGLAGTTGPSLVAAYVDRDALQLVLTRDDGAELKADLLGFAELVKQAAT